MPDLPGFYYQIVLKGVFMEDLLARVGWSKAYFADRIGVDARTLNRWIARGEGTGYTTAVRYLELVARVLGC